MKVLVCDDDKDYLDKCSQKLLELGEKHQVELELEKQQSGKSLLFFQESKYKDVDCIYMVTVCRD